MIEELVSLDISIRICPEAVSVNSKAESSATGYRNNYFHKKE